MIADRYWPHLRALVALGLPLIGANIARLLISVTDTVMVGQYGVEPLAALVIASGYFFVLFMLGSGYAIALMGVLASAIARRDATEVRRSTRMVGWLSGLHAIVILPLMWFSGAILTALGQKPEIAALAQEYLRVYGFAIAPMLWSVTLNSLLANLGRANVVLAITLIGLPVNAFLNWLLIFGNWGLPELGVRGSAIASLITVVLSLAAMVVYTLMLPGARIYQLAHNLWRPDWPDFRRMFRLGLPVGLTLVAETGLFAATSVMMGWISAQALAAHGIALQLASLAFMIHLGLASAATIRVGDAAGRGDTLAIRETAYAVIGLSVGFALVAASIFVLLPRTLGGLYIDSAAADRPQIIALVVVLLVWAALFQLADAMQAIALGLLRGVQDTQAPALIAAVAYWLIGAPTAYVAGFVLGFGPGGIWLGLLVGLAAAAGLLMRRFWAGEARGGWTRAGRTA